MAEHRTRPVYSDGAIWLRNCRASRGTGGIRLLTGALALLAVYAGASAQSHQDWQLCQGQDADAAIFACTKLIGRGQLKGPDLGTAYYHRGAAHLSEGEIDDAVDDLSEAIRSKPDFAEALFDRARALGRKGEFDRSIGDCNEVIRRISLYQRRARPHLAALLDECVPWMRDQAPMHDRGEEAYYAWEHDDGDGLTTLRP